jgi:hypothetical protein
MTSGSVLPDPAYMPCRLLISSNYDPGNLLLLVAFGEDTNLRFPKGPSTAKGELGNGMVLQFRRGSIQTPSPPKCVSLDI